MSNTRFEIQLSSYRGGRTLARIYDDYWDGLDTAVFNPAHPEEVNLKAFKELAPQLANLKPGWYAIRSEERRVSKECKKQWSPYQKKKKLKKKKEKKK